MKKEAKFLLGRHDFKSFQASDISQKLKEKNTVRTIKKLIITKKDSFIYINIEADGFLYKMVRNIVGTLLEIGNSSLSQGSMKKILAHKDRAYASDTAKAHGLMLLKVVY